MRHIEKGDIFEFKDGSIGIVISLSMSVNQIKMRKVRGCVGKQSKKIRIGRPYTYQLYTSEKMILKKAKKIGNRELLNILFWWRAE